MIEIVQSGFLDGVLGFLVHKIILYVSLSQLVSFLYPIIRIPKYLGPFFGHVQKSCSSYDFVKRIRVIRFAKIPLIQFGVTQFV